MVYEVLGKFNSRFEIPDLGVHGPFLCLIRIPRNKSWSLHAAPGIAAFCPLCGPDASQKSEHAPSELPQTCCSATASPSWPALPVLALSWAQVARQGGAFLEYRLFQCHLPLWLRPSITHEKDQDHNLFFSPLSRLILFFWWQALSESL